MLLTLSIQAQQNDLSYYLPDISYNRSIPTPADFLGYDVGDWHVTHDQLRFYMQALADASDRITIEEYARTYEHRPLLLMTITSPRNHSRLDEILEYRNSLTVEGDSSSAEDQPIVIYQGYSIHGNEASGSNASLLVAYYLAAGQSAELDQLLDNVVILLDPSFNPDGMQRFSSWVNTHKNKSMTADPEDREYSEAWPRGRTNHYWFDLNRDWLLCQHPESRGRIANFHKWKPHILTDHHEMGTNSTFFFMPGEPTRVNPITPQANQDLTAAIAEYHVSELDAIGSTYYSGEGFDDFYYGKGSTYPDANGCIGILFEQASARGHMQESINGILTFPFAIRNQVATSISTQKAAAGLKDSLHNFQRRFYQDNFDLGGQDDIKAYAFGEKYDKSRLKAFVDVLLQHDIEVYHLDDEHQDDYTYIVPMHQAQYRLIRGIFDRQVEFEDSLFYDVSAWTLPLAFNIEHIPLDASRFGEGLVGDLVTSVAPTEGSVKGGRSSYGYIMSWDDYFAPKAAFDLLSKGLRMKFTQAPFEARTALGTMQMPRGTVFIPSQNQDMDATEVFLAINEAAAGSGITFYSLTSGFTATGPDMGSSQLRPMVRPEILLAVGDGVSSYESGEMWHLFDQRYNIPVSKVDVRSISGVDLSRYTTIVLAGGSYRNISKRGVDGIKDWLRSGGVLIATRGAVDWAAGQGLLNARRVKQPEGENDNDPRPYANASRDRGGSVVGGAIFQVELDLTHPLTYGFHSDSLAVFRRGTSFYQMTDNVYATPSRYSEDPLLAGYINQKNLSMLGNTASIIVGGYGRGRVIGFADNPTFRAYWWGTQKLIANAVFFGTGISGGTVESAPPSNNTDE